MRPILQEGNPPIIVSDQRAWHDQARAEEEAKGRERGAVEITIDVDVQRRLQAKPPHEGGTRAAIIISSS